MNSKPIGISFDLEDEIEKKIYDDLYKRKPPVREYIIVELLKKHYFNIKKDTSEELTTIIKNMSIGLSQGIKHDFNLGFNAPIQTVPQMIQSHSGVSEVKEIIENTTKDIKIKPEVKEIKVIKDINIPDITNKDTENEGNYDDMLKRFYDKSFVLK